MTALKAHNSNRKLPAASDAMAAYMALWRSSAVDLPLALMSESFRFMSHRFQAQADHLASLTQCKTLEEALESQATFTRTTVSDYAAEANTIVQDARSATAVSRAA